MGHSCRRTAVRETQQVFDVKKQEQRLGTHLPRHTHIVRPMSCAPPVHHLPLLLPSSSLRARLCFPSVLYSRQCLCYVRLG